MRAPGTAILPSRPETILFHSSPRRLGERHRTVQPQNPALCTPATRYSAHRPAYAASTVSSENARERTVKDLREDVKDLREEKSPANRLANDFPRSAVSPFASLGKGATVTTRQSDMTRDMKISPGIAGKEANR
jgi:hypothetical protein